MTNPMLGMPQGAEWLIILAVVILIFGASKLPELARGTGQALRIFKSETKGLREDDDGKAETTPPVAAPPVELPPTTATSETPTTQDRQPDTHNG
jgi:sec-independent protein translocase protein TatA